MTREEAVQEMLDMIENKGLNYYFIHYGVDEEVGVQFVDHMSPVAPLIWIHGVHNNVSPQFESVARG